MPTLDEMKLEGPEVTEQIHKQLYRMDRNLQAMGLGAMTPEDLRGAFGKIKAAVVQVVQQKSAVSQQAAPTSPPAAPGMPPPTQPSAPAPQLPMSTFAEGGLVNDQTGQGTDAVRNRLGIR